MCRPGPHPIASPPPPPSQATPMGMSSWINRMYVTTVHLTVGVCLRWQWLCSGISSLFFQ